jgi:threonine/homoserine/homoserine lactone efflux protein
LIYLGARSLITAMSKSNIVEPDGATQVPHLRPASAFSQGVLSNLSNAKMVAFFVSLLPQFAGPHPSFVVLLALGLNFSLFTFVWLVAYTLAVERMGRLLRMRSVRRALDAVLGAVLAALGLRITAEALAG